MVKEYYMKSSVLFVLALFTGTALSAQNVTDFQYTAENGTVTITGYTGSAKEVAIPGRIDGLPVTVIGYGAFREKQLTGVTIPNGVTYIGEEAFASNLLTKVDILDSVTTIEKRAFYNNKLTGVIIPNSVSKVGDEVFLQNKLTSVTIPADVDIWTSSFNGLLYTYYTAAGNKAAVYAFSRSRYGDFDIIASSNAVEIEGYHGTAAELAIPAEINGLPVTAIGYGAFREKQLTGVTIPDSVTVIGDDAFSGNQLTNVTIPNGVTVIGDFAFRKNQLTNVTIGNSVITIERAAFLGNELTSVTIPDSVTAIRVSAFSGNPLSSVTMPDNVTTAGYPPAFPGNFMAVYNDGKAAGTYISGDGGWEWTKQ
jgi:hypothetical protein